MELNEIFWPDTDLGFDQKKQGSWGFFFSNSWPSRSYSRPSSRTQDAKADLNTQAVWTHLFATMYSNLRFAFSKVLHVMCKRGLRGEPFLGCSHPTQKVSKIWTPPHERELYASWVTSLVGCMYPLTVIHDTERAKAGKKRQPSRGTSDSLLPFTHGILETSLKQFGHDTERNVLDPRDT